MSEYTANLRASVARLLENTPVTEPPPPWQRIDIPYVGGATEVGFDQDSELLLVISSNGRGVIDCVSGEKVARDDDYLEYHWHDHIRQEAQGIGPLAGTTVRVAGLSGGELPQYTKDHWRTERVPVYWPDEFVLLHHPHTSPRESYDKFTRLETTIGTFRACGFSFTGRTLVLAMSDSLSVWGRDL